jgi:hypothetical protein
MRDQFFRIEETLSMPDEIIESKTDNSVELYYRRFIQTSVGDKYLCVVVKVSESDAFMITAYFTDAIKKGQLRWKRK